MGTVPERQCADEDAEAEPPGVLGGAGDDEVDGGEADGGEVDVEDADGGEVDVAEQPPSSRTPTKAAVPASDAFGAAPRRNACGEQPTIPIGRAAAVPGSRSPASSCRVVPRDPARDVLK